MLSGVMAEELWTGKNAGDECERGKRHVSPKLDGDAAKRGETHDESGVGRHDFAKEDAVGCAPESDAHGFTDAKFYAVAIGDFKFAHECGDEVLRFGKAYGVRRAPRFQSSRGNGGAQCLDVVDEPTGEIVAAKVPEFDAAVKLREPNICARKDRAGDEAGDCAAE